MNHMHITADQFIYNDLVKKICTGVYHYGDKLPPIRELCENYGFASTTVKKAMKQLRKDEFIKGETSKGTSVIFDSTNHFHVERLKLYASKYAIDEYNDMQIPSILFSSMIKAGIESSSKMLRGELKKDIEHILSKLREAESTYSFSQELFQKIISQIGNPFIVEIFLDCCNNSAFFVAPPQVDPQAFDKYRKVMILFYNFLLNTLTSENMEPIKHACVEMCNQISAIPNSFLLMLGNRSGAGLQKEKLYSRVIQSISAEILSGKVKKGDFFPRTPQMCKKYGVSRKTVAKAYGILESLHLIQIVPYKGTVLIADRNQPEIQSWMKQRLSQWTQETFYALEVFRLLGVDIFYELAKHANNEMIKKMEQNLQRQWYNAKNHHMLMLITDALITPLFLSLDSSLSHRQYDFLITHVIKFAAACSFQLKDKGYDLSKNIYEEASAAIVSLKKKDVGGFIEHFVISINQNTDLYTNIKDKLNIEMNAQWIADS